MKKLLIAIFIILTLFFLASAIYYWVTPAGSLPHHLPGYEAGSTHKHLKHGLAALILAVAFGIAAWFASGSKDKSSQSKPHQPKDSTPQTE